MKYDPKGVLRHLADTLDIGSVYEAFPGLTPEGLREIIRNAAAPTPAGSKRATLHVDGGARGNPGPAGYGFVLTGEDGSLIRRGDYIGVATNNVAEYRAAIAGMKAAVSLGITDLEILSDSELMVRQMTGRYRVKNQGLRSLFAQAQSAAAGVGTVVFRHVPREENRDADRLANMAIDARGPVSL